MKPTRITFVELEEHFEIYVDKAAEGETFVFEYGRKDFILRIQSTGLPQQTYGH